MSPQIIGIMFFIAFIAGCANFRFPPQQPISHEQFNTEISELKATLTQFASRLEGLETKLVSLETKLPSLNDKIDATKVSMENLLNIKKPQTTAVLTEPTSLRGKPVEVKIQTNNPESGLINDTAIQSYRHALILFKAKKHPESILAFSGFLEQYPDHPLAGSAQFYIGQSYFLQKEFKLAQQEFSRVLISYDRSRHVSETLKQLIATSEALHATEEAANYRHLLSSLFPQSPSAAPVLTPAPPPLDEPPQTADSPPPTTDGPPPTAPLQSSEHAE